MARVFGGLNHISITSLVICIWGLLATYYIHFCKLFSENKKATILRIKDCGLNYINIFKKRILANKVCHNKWL